jgi:dihydroflavonol-4-reductase
MRTALVTGATGFIGRHLVQALVERGIETTCLVREGSPHGALGDLPVRIARGDMRDRESVATAAAGADAVFHLASMLRAPWRAEFWTHNVEGTAKVAQACAVQSTPPRLIVVSSLAAGGPSIGVRARDESDGAHPVSRYGRMKLACEVAARTLVPRLPLSIVRPPMVFGEGDRAALPLFRSVSAGWHVVPVARGNGLAMVHAADLAEALISVAIGGERCTSQQPDDPTGVYYAAGVQEVAYADLGAAIAEALGVSRPRVVHIPLAATWMAVAATEMRARLRDVPSALNLDKAREARAGSWACNPSKLRDGLGWRPRELQPDRLRQTANWYRSVGWL